MKSPTRKQRLRFERVRDIGCVATVGNNFGLCGAAAQIHHCDTGMGRRKDHDKIIPLCQLHHTGEEGIHTLSRRKWQPEYGYETGLMAYVTELLGEGA